MTKFTMTKPRALPCLMVHICYFYNFFNIYEAHFFKSKDCTMYRVNQQCCPGRNCPETPPETLRGGSLGVLAKSLANPDKIYNLFFFIFFWICK